MLSCWVPLCVCSYFVFEAAPCLRHVLALSFDIGLSYFVLSRLDWFWRAGNGWAWNDEMVPLFASQPVTGNACAPVILTGTENKYNMPQTKSNRQAHGGLEEMSPRTKRRTTIQKPRPRKAAKSTQGLSEPVRSAATDPFSKTSGQGYMLVV